MSSHQDDDSSGEIFFNPPAPPNERSWRHPSEVRDEMATESHGRRTVRTVTMATAAMSMTLSVLLAIVLLPSRPQPRPERTAISTVATLTTSSETLSSEVSKFGYIANTDHPVAAMSTTGYLLTARIDSPPGEVVVIRTVENALVNSIVAAHETDLGVTWLHVIDAASGKYVPLGTSLNIPKKQIVSFKRGSRVWVHASPSRIHEAEVGVSSNSNQKLVPIDPRSTPAGVNNGPAFDELRNLVGWCVPRDGVTWMVPLAVLEERLLRLEASDQ